MSFRTNLQYLRAQRNMTQERLAMLLGVSRQAISKWESEKAYPEMDKLLRRASPPVRAAHLRRRCGDHRGGRYLQSVRFKQLHPRRDAAQ